MKKIPVTAITGKEILARDIYSDMDIVLMAKGTEVKTEYVSHLLAIGIEELYVETDLEEETRKNNTEEVIKKQCHDSVKTTLSKFSFCGAPELEKIQKVVDDVIDEIVEEPEVMYSVSGVRDRSESVYSHCLSVCALSTFLAVRMGLKKEQVRNIATGSLLHDIGYANSELELKNMKKEEFTQIENRKLRMHIVYGYDAVKKEKWLSTEAKQIVFSHHEAFDGTGYPQRITGDKISLETKIVSVCDMFDMMVYGFIEEKKKVFEAVSIIEENAGKKFDPKVVKKFCESVAVFPNGTIVYTDKKDKAIVVRQNAKDAKKPVIRLLEDSEGKLYPKNVEINLLKEKIEIVDTEE